MSIAGYIKEIGRGAAGARSLSTESAREVMGAVLDGRVTDMEIGAFVLAMRMKGETVEELTGFLQAVQARCTQIPTDERVVVIPSYNGARRLPNLTPLLARMLAQEGVRVLVHGVLQDRARVTSAEIFHDLGLPPAQCEEDIHSAWSRHEPAFAPLSWLCPPLQRLLDVRWVVGVRNSGHTVAKMLQPCAGSPALRLCNYTHPEFGSLLATWAQQQSVDAMLLRGTEGEAVADPRRHPRIDTWLQGELSAEWSGPAQDGVVAELPILPREHDAATTALYIQAVMSGERPAPAPLSRQVALATGALHAIQSPSRPLDLMA